MMTSLDQGGGGLIPKSIFLLCLEYLQKPESVEAA